MSTAIHDRAPHDNHVPLVQVLLAKIPRYASALAALIGLIILVEWTASSLRIARISERFVPMAPVTALGFVALGLGSLFHHENSHHRYRRAVARAMAFLVLGLSAVILIERAFALVSDVTFDIEQWLTPAVDSSQGFTAGRMSPLTACMFGLCALGYLLSYSAGESERVPHIAQGLVIVMLALASVLVVSYLYGTPLLYDTGVIPVALPTAISFAVLGIGFLFEQPDGIFLRLFASNSLPAQLARVAVPGSIGLILASGWLNTVTWVQAHDQDRIFGMAFVALATAALVTLLTIQSARQIQNALTRYKLLAEHSRDIMLFVRYTDGQILEANRAAIDAYGYSRDELLTKLIHELRSPDQQSQVDSQMNQANTDGILFETVHRRKDGSAFPVEVSSRGATMDRQRVLLSVIRDITNRKHAERTLLQAHAFNESLIQTIPFGMDIVDLAGNILFLNDKLGAMVGHDALQRKCWQIYKDDQTQCAACPLKQAITLDETRVIETSGVLGGKIFSINHTGMIYQGKTAILEIFQDITALKRAEEGNIRFGQILEESLNEIYLFDAQTLLFIQVNQGARENLGYTMRELQELTPLDLKPEFTRDSFETLIQPLRTNRQKQIQFATIHRRKNGSMYPVQVSLQLSKFADTPVFVAIILDITARRQRERELQAIATISAALRAAHTRAEMLPIILDQIAALIHLDSASIGLIEEHTGDVIVEQARGVWSDTVGRRTPRGMGISHQVITTGKPYITDDLANDPLMYWRDVVKTIKGMVAVPLATQTGSIGMIAVGVPTRLHDDDLRVLTAIADIAANAIHRADLHEQTEQQLARLTALSVIDRAINASLDLRVVLNILLDQSVTLLHADAAAILLFNRAAQTIEWRAERGMRASMIAAAPIRLGNDATSRAIIERVPIHLDLRAHADTIARAGSIAREDFVAYSAVPLIAKGAVKGVIEIFHRAPPATDNEWLASLYALAEQAAIAIDNAELFDRLQRANNELTLAYDATIEGWSRALDLRDKETEGHTRRVTEITVQLARALNLREDQLTHIRRGALLHDIGKMGIPDAILLKPGPLTSQEWEIMRLHPVYARELLIMIDYLQEAIEIPYCHHEKWDGTGYPRGLAGDAIPLAARIFAIVDVWDALSSDRPYRAAWPPDRVLVYLHEQSGKHFDPAIVETFMQLEKTAKE